MFTVIQHRTRQLIKEPTLKNVIRAAYEDAIDFLFQIDDPSPLAIDDDFYDSLAAFKILESEKSTWNAFNNNKYYN